MASEAANYAEDVEQLRQRFAEFRQAHAVRSRLPKELWGAAAKLARRDGIAATARALSVDRRSLQRWTDRFEPRSCSRGRPSRKRQGGHGEPGFLELLAANPGTASSCLVEVESPRGQLRLDLKNVASGQLGELIRAFTAS